MAKDKDLEFPRMVYRGTADDDAETKVVANDDELSAAQKDGWRLTRVDNKHPVPDDTDTIKIPAQTVTTSAATEKVKK